MGEREKDADVAVKLEAIVAENDNPARVQAILEESISAESQQTVSAILDQVSRLSAAEKLLLYLRLPSTPPNASSQADRCSRGEMQRAIAWIRTHLAPQPALSLPKQHVYREYTAYAARQAVKPVSSADFGKAVKAAFPAVRARRLGVRGQSRYCYAGVGKAATLATPSLPGETLCHHKSLCQRPSTDTSEFIDFSAVAARPPSLERPGRQTASRQTQRFVPIAAKDSSKGGAVAPLDNLLAPGSASPDLDAELLHYFSTPRLNTPAPPKTEDKLCRLRRVLQRSLDPPLATPPRPLDSTPRWNPTSLPGPPTQRGYVTAPNSPVPYPFHGRAYKTNPPSPVPFPVTKRGYLTAPQSPEPVSCNDRVYQTDQPLAQRGYLTVPSSPVPFPVSKRGYLTAPHSPEPVSCNDKEYHINPASPLPVPFTRRGYVTAPHSPVPLLFNGSGYKTNPPSPVPLPVNEMRFPTAPPSPVPSNGRGYATAPPSPGAWPMGAWPGWRSQSVPVEPPPTPVPAAFRDFFGWDSTNQEPRFELVSQASDINTPLLGLDMGSQGLDMDGQGMDMNGQGLDIGSQELGLDMNGQGLDMDSQELGLDINGQGLEMDQQLFGELKQSLDLTQGFVNLDGESLGIEGQFLGLESQQMQLEMEVVSYGVAQSTQPGNDLALHRARRH